MILPFDAAPRPHDAGLGVASPVPDGPPGSPPRAAAPSTSATPGVDAALRALRRGQVIAIPTDTVYGLAANVRHKDGLAALFALKGRPSDVQIPILVAEQKESYGFAEVTPRAERLMHACWPGSLTIVLRRRAGLEFDLGGDAETVGLRCPGHAPLRMLLWRSRALAVTSANLHGEPPLNTAEEVQARFGDQVPVVLDGGTCDGRPSTVVSLVGPEPECLREGAIDFAEILAALG